MGGRAGAAEPGRAFFLGLSRARLGQDEASAAGTEAGGGGTGGGGTASTCSSADSLWHVNGSQTTHGKTSTGVREDEDSEEDAADASDAGVRGNECQATGAEDAAVAEDPSTP